MDGRALRSARKKLLSGSGAHPYCSGRVAAVHSSALEAGLVVESRYCLDHWLGGGGMGVVWAATDVSTGQAVALKFLRPEYAAELGMHQRFLREARAAAAVCHPNVVAVHEVLENDGFPAIVMDLLRGETLAKKLAQAGALSIQETAALLLPVISVIGTAHACGVVHRDLKPDNVFICNGEGLLSARVRVLDFGIAKLLQREPGMLSTQTGTLVGSPLYMSPEQVFCEGDIDHRADAWSLGIILYQCLAGYPPTKAVSVGQTLKIITTGTLVSLAQGIGDLPQEVFTLVDALLSRDRSLRPELVAVRSTLRRYAPQDESPDFQPPARLRAPAAVDFGENTFLSASSSDRGRLPPATLSRPRRSSVQDSTAPYAPALAKTAAEPEGRSWRRLLGVVAVLATAGAAAWVWVHGARSYASSTSQQDHVSRLESTVATIALPALKASVSTIDSPLNATVSYPPEPRSRALRSRVANAAGSTPKPSAEHAGTPAPIPSTGRSRGALVEAPPF